MKERDFDIKIGLQNIELAGSIYHGYKEARNRAGRPLVDTVLTTGFVAMSGVLMDSPPRKNAITHTYLLEDVLERQNCTGDEIINGYGTKEAYWLRTHYAEEYAGIMSSVHNDLTKRYGMEEGREKATTIAKSLEEWFFVNGSVESYVSGRIGIDGLTSEEAEIIRPLESLEGKEKAKAYRELVGEKWLSVLLLTLADGDAETVEEIKKPVMVGASLLQLSEDYANTRRDSRVKKLTLMSDVEQVTRSRHLNEFFELNKLAGGYIDEMGLNSFEAVAAKAGLFTKSIISRAKARRRGDNNWRKKEFFEECDVFEQRVDDVLYGHGTNT